MDLKIYIEKHHSGNQSAFAKQHGFSNQNVTRAIRGEKISVPLVRRIAKVTGGKVKPNDIIKV